MKLSVTCGDVCFDWFEWNPVEIDTDKYVNFTLDYRMDSWHLIGHYKRGEQWTGKELSKCQLAYNGAIEFILKTDKPICSFRNCHNSKDFPKALSKLLKDVEKERQRCQEIYSEQNV